MADERTIEKNLICEQDIAYGEEDIAQTRNGGSYTGTQIRGLWPINEESELETLDPSRHPKAILIDGDILTIYTWDEDEAEWVNVSISDNSTVNDAIAVTAYKRQTAEPTKPADDEGSYTDLIPAGWLGYAPAGELTLWATSRVLSRTGESPQDDSWSDVTQMTDTGIPEFQFSSNTSDAGNPTDDPDNWTISGNENSTYMAVRTILNGVTGAWNVLKTGGTDGEDGEDGVNGTNGIDAEDTTDADYNDTEEFEWEDNETGEFTVSNWYIPEKDFARRLLIGNTYVEGRGTYELNLRSNIADDGDYLNWVVLATVSSTGSNDIDDTKLFPTLLAPIPANTAVYYALTVDKITGSEDSIFPEQPISLVVVRRSDTIVWGSDNNV